MPSVAGVSIGKVFAENRDRQIPSRQLCPPVVVVRERVTVNRLVRSTVGSEIGLTVAIQVELAQSDAARNRFLEDPRSHVYAVPNHFARKSSIH